jgi:hypothetical protein
VELDLCRSWQDALELIDALGYQEIARGDWSWVHSTTHGAEAIRTTPFDPAFLAFLDLCAELSGNPHLPDITAVHRYPEGGYSVVMERLAHVDEDTARKFLEDLSRAEPDTPLGRLHDARTGFHSELPLFAGVDDNPANVLRRSDGTLVLTDSFWINGPELYRMVDESPAHAIELYPASALRRWAQIPAFDRAASNLIVSRLGRFETEEVES